MNKISKIIVGVYFIVFNFLYTFQSDDAYKNAIREYIQRHHEVYQKCLYLKKCIQSSTLKKHIEFKWYSLAGECFCGCYLGSEIASLTRYNTLQSPWIGLVVPAVIEVLSVLKQNYNRYENAQKVFKEKQERWLKFSDYHFREHGGYWHHRLPDDLQWFTENKKYLQGFEKVPGPIYEI